MNETTAAAPGASLIPDGVATITTMHFVFMGLVAAFAIAIILAGIRHKRTRKQAERTVERNAEEAGVPMVEPDSAPLEEAPAPTPAPAPAPPPSAPAPVPAAPVDEPLPERRLADEPVAAAAPMDATPASIAADTPAPPPPPAAAPQDQPIALLKGLGPKIQQRLGELGVTTVGDIAALNDAQAAALDAQLGPFSGRMNRDRWREQARLLAAGDRAGFEAAFGRL